MLLTCAQHECQNQFDDILAGLADDENNPQQLDNELSKYLEAPRHTVKPREAFSPI